MVVLANCLTGPLYHPRRVIDTQVMAGEGAERIGGAASAHSNVEHGSAGPPASQAPQELTLRRVQEAVMKVDVSVTLVDG
jgi:hypothetical protein